MACLITWRCPIWSLCHAKADTDGSSFMGQWFTLSRKTSSQSWGYGWLSFHGWAWNHWPRSILSHFMAKTSFQPNPSCRALLMDHSSASRRSPSQWMYYSLASDTKLTTIDIDQLKSPRDKIHIGLHNRCFLAQKVQPSIERTIELPVAASIDFRIVHYVEH